MRRHRVDGGERHVLELVGHDVDRPREGRAARRRRRSPPASRRRATCAAQGASAGSKTWVCMPSRAAAIASIRPSWPPPRMPIRPPGAQRLRRPSGDLGHRRRSAPPARRRAGPRAPRRSSPASPRRAAPRSPRPPSPIASVPTGTPFGICTIDSSESRPDSALLCTGTPSTGTRVLAASIPGRCAAPPAPAMIARKPAPGRRLGVGEQPVGRAVRRDDARPRAARRARRAPRPPRAWSPSRTGSPSRSRSPAPPSHSPAPRRRRL